MSYIAYCCWFEFMAKVKTHTEFLPPGYRIEIHDNKKLLKIYVRPVTGELLAEEIAHVIVYRAIFSIAVSCLAESICGNLVPKCYSQGRICKDH